MSKFLYIVSATVLMVGFQNCAKTTFSSSGSSTYLAALDGDAPAGGTVGDKNPPTDTTGDTTGGTPGGTTGGTTTDTTTTTTTTDHGNGHDTTVAHDNGHDSSDSDSDLYLCVLEEGQGKSLKLGLVQDALDGVHSVANVVCVSKTECLGDVAAHFKVSTAAYERGFCDHNPHVQGLTDAEVKKLLGI